MSNFHKKPSYGSTESRTQWQHQPMLLTSDESSLPSYPTNPSLFNAPTPAANHHTPYAINPSLSNTLHTLGSQLPGLTMTNSNMLAQPFPPTDPPGPFADTLSWNQPDTTYHAVPSWIPPHATKIDASAVAQATPRTSQPLRDDLGQRGIPSPANGSNNQPSKNSYKDEIDREEGEVSEGDDQVDPDVAPPSRQDSANRLSPSDGNPDLGFDKSLMSTEHLHRERSNQLSGSAEDEQTSKLPSTSTLAEVTQASIKQGLEQNPAQVRSKVHGALLSLAAHNIRFHDLVKENINPNILRQLYEEIGVKVPPTDASSRRTNTVTGSQDKLSVRPSGPPRRQDQGKDANGVNATSKFQQLPEIPAELSSSNAITPVGTDTPKAHVSNNAAKPLERKDVIAQMLAAKAKKSTVVAKKKSVGATLSPMITTPPIEQERIEAPTRVKNKAQTELARQRMEQLKKGLHKLQQRASTTTNSSMTQNQDEQNQDGLFPEREVVGLLQHPLPNRPPAIKSPPNSSIPGLFMADSETTPESQSKDSLKRFAENLHVAVRSSHRKRPRASDFDDIVPSSKRTFPSEDRLVIDISEDDSMYGDDEDSHMDIFHGIAHISRNDQTPSSDANNLSASDCSLNKSEQIFSQSLKFQSSQGRSRGSKDTEDLRQKDLQIMAMRKKIAELELRKRARLATSRTNSPGTPHAEPSAPHREESQPLILLAHDFSASVEPSDADVFATDQFQQAASITKLSCETNLIESPLYQSDEGGSQSDSSHLDQFSKVGQVPLDGKVNKEVGGDERVGHLNILVVERPAQQLEEFPVQGAFQPPQPLSSSSEDKNVTTPPSVDKVTDEEFIIVEPSGLEVPKTPDAVESDQRDVSVIESETHSNSASMESSELSHENEFSSSNEEKGLNPDSDSVMDESLDSMQSMSLGSPTYEASAALEPNLPRSSLAFSLNGVTIDEDNTTEACREQDLSLSQGLEHDLGPASGTGVINSESDSNIPSDSSAASDLYEPPEPLDLLANEPHQLIPPFASAPLLLSQSSDIVGFEDNHKVPTSLKVPDRGLTDVTQEFTDGDKCQFNVLENMRHVASPESTYSPYISPLKLFKAYRFDPNFQSDTIGGYRSLTYSHNIDLWKPLCPFEASGGVCNDHSCEHQHWRDMELSDDNILIQMGSIREGKTPEEQQSYVEGLKSRINDMQRDKVKDFETVAAAIVAYRRRYLQDPSRILPL